MNNVVEQPGERHSFGEHGLISPSQAVDTQTTGPLEVSRVTSGEPSRAATLPYPQYLWAQVMERQMGPQQEVPPVGPGIKAPRIYRLLSPKYRKSNTDTSHLNTDPAPSKYRQLPIPSGHHRDDIPGLRPQFSLGPGLGRSRAPMAGHNPTSANSTSARLRLRQVYLLRFMATPGPLGCSRAASRDKLMG